MRFERRTKSRRLLTPSILYIGVLTSLFWHGTSLSIRSRLGVPSSRSDLLGGVWSAIDHTTSTSYRKIVSKISSKNNGDYRPAKRKLPRRTKTPGNMSYLDKLERMGHELVIDWSPIDHTSERYSKLISTMNGKMVGDYNPTSGKKPKKVGAVILSAPSYLEKIDKTRGYRRKLIGRTHGNSTEASVRSFFNLIVSEEMKEDVRTRRKVYKSDWTDAFKCKRKTVPAILFLYFACLAPAVSFGTIASQITQGSMGIVEFLLSAGVSGMAYAVMCGQPMAFIAPTGLTLAFISGLYRFCALNALPFFPVYSWVGLWTSFFFVLLGLGGSSQLIRFCTRFTDEIFNALLSVNFIYEAVASLKRNFELADPMNLTMPFVSLAMALTTCIATMKVATFDSSKYLNQKARTSIKDFGPVTVFVLMSILNQRPWLHKFGVPTLAVPASFQLAGGRNFLVNLSAVPHSVRLLCILPAILLTSLFYMDQNISVRVVNNPDNKLKKGAAYNLDMVALGLITGALSLVGLPWMCGATVQSLNHVRAMTDTRFNKETGQSEIVAVTETRFTGFAVHALITATLVILPLLGFVPIPVVAGVFLFLGRKLMTGNSFLQRIRDIFVEKTRLASDHPILAIGRKKTTIFTITQVLCLFALWTFKQNSATAIFFPGAIGLLIFIRAYLLPVIFNETELVRLGDPTPQ